MSTVRKGRNNELDARKAYERAGFWVYSPETAQFGDNDLWNLFDLAAIDVREGELVLVQVKSNSQAGLEQWVNDTRPFRAVSDVTVHWLIKHDREGWQCMEPITDGVGYARTAYDEMTDDRVGPHRDTALNTGEGLTEWLA